MTKQSLSRTTGIVARGLRTSTTRTALFAPRRAVAAPTSRALLVPFFMTKSRFLSTTPSQTRGILPDSDDPAPPNVQDDGVKAIPADLTDGEYHEVADAYLDVIVSELETLADKNESIEVEYSAGVLTFVFPDIGTYVINKQPPNKQIWLSSPISGPKRYDYVVSGEGQSQKEDTAVGDWVYIRDGSTLGELFLKELNIDLSMSLGQ
ncbi:mitochondrial iron uptake protein [Diaporthe amygdali]|uniref:mitochondrial iron uptake protein n=1 Tax=Phomopsis amygdali TaxID=1214568 RepID=UPI0022FE2B45|nr:mitochondrial iron uptake protein [Diaporthe amygdali]KAJ0124525.1 mitochondrial iron uptake protein [Diaporthe amygdali]